MNLIIDIGNTFTKVAIVNGDKVLLVDRYETLTDETIEGYLSKFNPEKSIVSSVGKKNDALVNLLKSRISTIDLDQTTKLPIVNRYKTPGTLGRDRIAAVVGANYLYPSKNILAIDSGTAITYDFIDNDNQYHGGAISPGIRLRFTALNQHTANLPLLSSTDSFPLIGMSTKECISSGVLNGAIHEMDSYISQVKLQYPNVVVVLTGGDADFFVNKLKNSIFVVQNLVIIGLNRILEFNAKH